MMHRSISTLENILQKHSTLEIISALASCLLYMMQYYNHQKWQRDFNMVNIYAYWIKHKCLYSYCLSLLLMHTKCLNVPWKAVQSRSVQFWWHLIHKKWFFLVAIYQEERISKQEEWYQVLLTQPITLNSKYLSKVETTTYIRISGAFQLSKIITFFMDSLISCLFPQPELLLQN